MRTRKKSHRFTEGVRLRDLPSQLSREAKHAFGVLTREDARKPPRGVFRRLWHRVKAAFYGVAYKLSPPRRILFAFCLLLALMGRPSDDGNDEVFLMLGFLGLLLLLVLELADRVAVRDELEVARQLQRDLLPGQAPAIPGYELAFSYRTANTIGGDYYDFLPMADGRVALVSGDASGHGIAAGLLMAIASTTLKLGLDTDPRPEPVVDLVNRALLKAGGPRAFMTLYYALLDAATGNLSYVCAGHPFPMLRRAGGEIVELGSASLPLGMRPELELQTETVELERGDLVVLYSDGLPEAVDETDEAFGYERLRRALEDGGTAQQVHDRLLAAVDRFTGSRTLEDDRSLVVVRRLEGR